MSRYSSLGLLKELKRICEAHPRPVAVMLIVSSGVDGLVDIDVTTNLCSVDQVKVLEDLLVKARAQLDAEKGKIS